MARRAPQFPLAMRRDMAAIAVDMSVAQFERAVAEGTMPLPIIVAGEERWSLRAIEAALGTLTGEDAADWRVRQREINSHAA